MKKVLIKLVTIVIAFSPALVSAEEIPMAIKKAVVWVHCGKRQGSGVVINDEKKYILTNAHVLLDLNTLKPGTCEVGFIKDESLQPSIYYWATPEKYVFEESSNRDFAILKLGEPKQIEKIASFAYLKTDEFSRIGDPISILAYPGSALGKQNLTTGTINELEQGMIMTDAVISSGASGGAGVNVSNSLIGMATRILLVENGGQEEVVNYQLVDLRAVLEWLDTFGANAHDNYFIHADFDRFHKASTYIQSGALSCTLLAKSEVASTVYCLKNDGTRTVFPNDATFYSWIQDFSAVQTVPLNQLSTYRLTQNVTMKPGSLIKITTDPKVYLVSDNGGTIRWIENENKAKELFGDGWAGFVKDVPDTFFTNYQIGYPIL